ncbi:MAG: penicillin-binding protein activator [Gammaproteobacteria bacterium]|nr:penicillin-binding protein activator [Gammaproteobacteria bacterium]
MKLNSKAPRPNIIIATVALAIGLLSACAPQTTVKETAPVVDPTEAAVALQRAGRFDEAALEWLALAAQFEGPKGTAYRLHAVEAWLDDGSIDSARLYQAEAEAAVGELPVADQQRMALNQARLAAAGNAFADAATIVTGLDLNAMDELARPRALDLRATLAERFGRYADALRDRVRRDALLTPGPVQEANHAAIWRIVDAMDQRDLDALTTVSDAQLRGWATLGVVARTTLFDTARFTAALGRWQAQHADHPANVNTVPMLLERSDTLSRRPGRIALLLPFDSRYGEVSRAVRDGLLAAWYMQSGSAWRPEIVTYNANAANLASVYELAVGEGAEMIIGPLQKDAVQVLAARDELPVPTLALNALEPGPTDPLYGRRTTNLYQFGLIPEQEAREVAERAHLEGHQLALVLGVGGAWGDRVIEAFATHWQALGGTMLEAGRFSGSSEPHAESVRSALNIDASEERRQQLQRLLGSRLEFEPRRRQDADFIFLAANAVDARQVMPQLRYYGAGNVPVFATSHVFGGTPNPARDRDLDGLRFGDMPLVIDPTGDPTFGVIDRWWPKQMTTYKRFYALGLDVYRIIPYLGQLDVQRGASLPGSTGRLTMNARGTIIRRLDWARFGGGTPVALDQDSAASPVLP